MADATQVQRRRGTSSQCDAMIPADGEIIVDQTNDILRVGDGLRNGGFHIPNAFNIQQSKYNFGVAGGTADALTLTLPIAPAAYAQPLTIKFKATNTNLSTATINVNGLGAVEIRKIAAGIAVSLSPNDIASGVIYDLVFDGTYFLMTSVSSVSGPTAGTTYTIKRMTGELSMGVAGFPSADQPYGSIQSLPCFCLMNGSITVSLQHRRLSGQSGGPSHARVCKNGSSLTEWTTTSESYVSRTLDVDVQIGDLITIQQARTSNSGGNAQMRNVLIQSGVNVGAIA